MIFSYHNFFQLHKVAIVWAQAVASRWLKQSEDKLQCLAPTRIPIAGKIHAMVFDKTGTITKDGMDFLSVLPAVNGDFTDDQVYVQDEKWIEELPCTLQHVVGLCHTVTTLAKDGSLVGNHVECSMVTASGWSLPSPDTCEKRFLPPKDLVLTCPGVTSKSVSVQKEKEKKEKEKKKEKTHTVQQENKQESSSSSTPPDSARKEPQSEPSRDESQSPSPEAEAGDAAAAASELSDDSRLDERVEYVDVVRELPFDHHRMTSGVVTKMPNGTLQLLVKGSYERISAISKHSTVPSDFNNVTGTLASESYYILGIAARVLDKDVDYRLMSRDELESDLTFHGLLLFRNEMKEDSAEALAELRGGNVKSIMCTGDNAFTGIAVARAAGMLPPAKDLTTDVILGDVTDNTLVFYDYDREKDIDFQDVMAADPTRTEIVLTASAFNALALPKSLPNDEEVPLLEGTEKCRRSALAHIEATAPITHLMPMVRVLARMKPNDKVSCIRLLQDRGLVVGMVGDGGNDCGALRSAHVGLALSEAEASLVAPFSTASKSLKCVGRLVKMGRCCLQTATASTLWYVFVGVTYTPAKVYLAVQPRHAYISEWGLIYASLIIPLGVTALDIFCKPRLELANIRPTSGIFTARSITMVAIPTIIYIAGFFTINAILYHQPWYDPCDTSRDGIGIKDYWYFWSDNYDITVWLCLFLFYYPLAGYVLSFGYKFRRHVWQNIPLTLYTAFSCFVSLWLLLAPGAPSWVHCVFRVNCDTVTSMSMQGGFWDYISASQVGGCNFGPQLCPEHAVQKAAGTYQVPTMENKCSTSTDPNWTLKDTVWQTGMPDDVKEQCTGPNNCPILKFKNTFKIVTKSFFSVHILNFS